ncbi:MAG: chaperonin GroEL [Planctomycetes bacterium]|nr:chaperonin GroEL [Planctomycetota bacterium]
MAKQLVFHEEAREALFQGVSKLSKAVISTLGPRGRNAVLDKGWGGPTITKDGVTVAEEIALENKYENQGAQLVKEAASKTGDIAGDGTTTATLLAYQIVREGLRYLTAGASSASISRGIKKAVQHVTDELQANAKKIKGNPQQILQVATIASNNDAEVGNLIADAMKRVGEDGVITVENGKALHTEVNVVEGMQFDRGYLSPHFVTDADSMECVMEHPAILIHEDKISTITKLLPLLEASKKANRPLLIIAEDIEGEALATLVVNKMRGILNVSAVKAPGYGDRRKAMLQDLAILTGGTAVFKDSPIDLQNVKLAQLGSAKKIRIDNDKTTVIEGLGNATDIEARCNQIRKEISVTTSDYDREKLQERLAKLAGGIAQINVGAATETEVKERKARIEDALAATRAATEEGVLPGGGVALLRAAQNLDQVVCANEDEKIGVEILKRALQAPIRTIADNCGVDGGIVARTVLKNAKYSYGYNALTAAYGDMFEFGILDPTKVTRSALQNASSVAALLLTTSAVITEKPKKEKKDEAPDMDEMDY